MIDKLEKKFGKFAIRGLMKYVIILYVAGFIMNMINPYLYYEWLMLDVDKLLKGQVWRLITFIIQPVNTNNIFSVFLSLYISFLFGSMLEGIWGSFRFNLYYFSGILFNALAVIVIYIVTRIAFGVGLNFPVELTYLNDTLFLAFAVTFPDTRFGFNRGNGISMFTVVYLMAVTVNVFQAFQSSTYDGMITLAINLVWIFVLCMGPKGKHLALAFLVIMGIELVQAFFSGGIVSSDGVFYIITGWHYGVIVLIAMFFALLNFLILFISLKKKGIGYKNPYRKQFMDSIKRANAARQSGEPERHGRTNGKIIVLRPQNTEARHKCAICGRTEKDDDSLEFRFCSKCNGNYEYCSDHLYTHTHVE